MGITWAYQGSPFLPILLLPNYAPHAYKVAEWSIAYFLFFRRRYKLRAFPMFLFAYGSLEVLFNISYLLMHTNIQFGEFPFFDAQYPLRLSLYFLALIVGLILGKPQLRLPFGIQHWHPRASRIISRIKWMVIGIFLFEQLIGYATGYPFTNGIVGDFLGNTIYLLTIWAVIETRKEIGKGDQNPA